MPNRLIRDSMLESEAVLSLPAEGRWLYVSLLLSADDFGLFEATPFKLARRADLRRELVERLMPMLADADLVRIYPGEGVRVFGFIPRYRQKLQTKRARHPMPVDALFADDPDMVEKVEALRQSADTGALIGAFGKEWNDMRERVFARDGYACVRCASSVKLSAHHLQPKSKGGKHAEENLTTLCAKCNSWARNNEGKCNEIKHLVAKTVSGSMLGSIYPVSTQLPEVEVEVEQIQNPPTPLPGGSLKAVKGKAASIPSCPESDIVALYHSTLPDLPRCRLMPKARSRAIRSMWTWILTSKRSDGAPRATTAAEAMDWLKAYFERATDNDFLMGRTKRSEEHSGWRCDLDFLLTTKGLKQVIEKTQEAA